MKVLIIEDDPTDLKLMGAVLITSGHSVQAITCGEQAVEAVAADNPDIILLDLRLPGIDGLALVRRLKANSETAKIPIVAVTAYPEWYPRNELALAGCETCIVKPIDTRKLASQIENAARPNAGR
jgi:CheY-like chemotaxis protein